MHRYTVTPPFVNGKIKFLRNLIQGIGQQCEKLNQVTDN
jgi:hypothetical protein